MLPTSPEYYCLLATVFFAFWLVRVIGAGASATGLLLAVNLFCYAKWGLLYLALIPAAATTDFFLASACAGTKSAPLRRLILLGSLAVNVGLIFFCRLAPRAGIAMSLGLSFYAFQALTYTIDVYRKDAAPIPSYLRYLTSVTFFPSAIAGPIARVAALAPQLIWKGSTLNAADGSRALFLIGLGLAKKFLIADYLGRNLVDRVFDLPTLYSGGDVLFAVYGYAFQLYYDFSGYSDIAIGSAALFGIRLPANFNSPYRATNIADFWRRWHITFSNWLRDYLYFALPGKRTRLMPYLNLVIVMVLGGLWHGNSLTFLVWGALHGTGLAIFRLWQAGRRDRKGAGTAASRIAARLLTFHFVLLGWIFFRAADVGTAWKILGQLASSHGSFENVTPAFLAVLGCGAVLHFLPDLWHDRGLRLFSWAPAPLQAAALAILALAIQSVSTSAATPFIYSKF